MEDFFLIQEFIGNTKDTQIGIKELIIKNGKIVSLEFGKTDKEFDLFETFNSIVYMLDKNNKYTEIKGYKISTYICIDGWEYYIWTDKSSPEYIFIQDFIIDYKLAYNFSKGEMPLEESEKDYNDFIQKLKDIDIELIEISDDEINFQKLVALKINIKDINGVIEGVRLMKSYSDTLLTWIY